MGQCIFRHIQSNSLASLYNSNEEFRTTVRQLNSLALLPINKIDSAYESIKLQLEKFDQQNEINALLIYFEKTWLNPDSLYPKHLWNKYREHKRTNNDPEGINNKINSLIYHDHPNIYVLIRALMDVHIDYEMQMRNLK